MPIIETAADPPRATPYLRPAASVQVRSCQPTRAIDYLFLAGLTTILASVVLSHGGMSRPEFEASLLALGLFTIAFWTQRRAGIHAPALEWQWKLPLAGFPLLVALQLVPLPIELVAIVSPARAELAVAPAPVLGDPRFVPLSVEPATTFAHLVRLLAYLSIFLIVRELGSSLAAKRWLLALPLVAIAIAEATLAIVQWTAGAGQIQSTGTYVNPNHLAGLLGLVLPLAVAITFTSWTSSKGRPPRPLQDLAFAGALGAAAVIALGVVLSLSRMGLLSAVAGVCAAVAMTMNRQREISWTFGGKTAASILAVGVAGAFIFFSPDKLISRISYLGSGERITAHSRLPLWRDTLQLVGESPLLGCGLGAFEAPFLKHKTSEPMLRDQYAHSDYLQVLAETGFAGFVLVSWALITALRCCWTRPSTTRTDRALSAAAFGAFTAIALHSLTDFNLYIPANAMTLTWIGGIAASVPGTSSTGASFDATPPVSRRTRRIPLFWTFRR